MRLISIPFQRLLHKKRNKKKYSSKRVKLSDRNRRERERERERERANQLAEELCVRL